MTGRRICRARRISRARRVIEPARLPAAGLRLDDLWIHLDPFLPNRSALDALRQWWAAADGVVGAGGRLAQKVDVALYECAVRRFGIRSEFVAWRPELSSNQWRERQSRPEWAPQVTTVDGRVLLKLRNKEIQELGHRRGMGRG